MERIVRQSQGLTAHEICDAFPEECLEYLPVVHKKLKKELKLYFDCQKRIEDAWWPTYWKIFALWMLDIDKPKEEFKYLKKVETMVRIMGIGGRRNRRERGMSILPLEEVKQIPIMDVCDFKKIRKTGRRTMVSCPLHADLTPSMLINTNNTFHCFSCQKSGTVIDLIMELHGLTFVDAVKHLKGFKK